ADDVATLDEDTEARFTTAALLANDTDVDNAHSDLTITAVGNASHGSVQLVAGEIVFTPDINFNGTASFSYTVSDGVGGDSGTPGESNGTVTLTFNPVNDAPVTNDELLWGKRDVSYTLTQTALLANDMDAETPTALLRISAVSNAQHGTAVLGADGSVRFTPEAGYAGRGSFDYLVQDPDGATSTATAQIDFSHININPLATDDGFTGYEDMALNIAAAQLLVNDSDADNAAADLRVTAVANAQNGTVALQADGSVRFVPAENFYGTASFQYQVSDGDGGHTWATARLNVQGVNDAPIIEDILYGRPIYGYQRTDGPVTGGGDGVGATQDMAVYSQAEALVLAGRHELFNRSLVMTSHDSEGYVSYAYSYTEVAPTYYRNGDMRPVATQALDADFYSEENPFRHQYPGNTTRWAVDDLYRQGGNAVAYDPDGDSSAITFSIGSGPQHGHAWANQYTSLQADRWIDHTQAPAHAVAQTGAWQYYSQRGDPYAGADAFTLTVTDGDGASTQVAVNTAHVASSASGGGGGKPVTLDLDGNGLQYVGLDDSQAYFDLNHDGWRERLAWVAGGDALLARDIGGDRVIDRAVEISFVGYLAGARTDLEGLAAFDSNGNGLLDRLDARWHEFGAWRDANGDGTSAPGEFRSLDEIGITQIGLQSDHQIRQFEGVTEFGQSRFTWADGRTGAVGDVAFAADGTAHDNARLPGASSYPMPDTMPAAPVAMTPEHIALLMAQVISTATAAWERASANDMPMGRSGPADDQDAQHALAATQAQWADAAQAQAAQMHGFAA
ncbi:MAG: tandem-95 repeat protein, partial [Polaromonas sp.]|nr:tandem-95 repeat protein [Polaromonas sp.]